LRSKKVSRRLGICSLRLTLPESEKRRGLRLYFFSAEERIYADCLRALSRI
jgi:hypothetical protein